MIIYFIISFFFHWNSPNKMAEQYEFDKHFLLSDGAPGIFFFHNTGLSFTIIMIIKKFAVNLTNLELIIIAQRMPISINKVA